MRLSLVAAFAAALLSTTALAADKAGPAPEPVIGLPATAFAPSCYAQGFAGAAVNTVKAEGAALPAALSASGWTVGAGLGCDVRLDRIVIGALARVEIPVDTDGDLIKSDKSWMAGFRAGYLLNTGLLAYGLVGYSQADLKIDFNTMDRNGLVLGGGLEIKLGPHTSLIAEYTRTGMDGTDIGGGVELKPVDHNFRLGMNFRFNNGLFGE